MTDNEELMRDIEIIERANLNYGARFMAIMLVNVRRMELQRQAKGEPPIASLSVEELIELANTVGSFSA